MAKHPQKIGTSWTGARYTHGPRKHRPSRYSELRVSKPTKSGTRMVFGKIKGTSRWEVQSKMTPKRKVLIRRNDGVKQHYRVSVAQRRRATDAELMEEAYASAEKRRPEPKPFSLSDYLREQRKIKPEQEEKYKGVSELVHSKKSKKNFGSFFTSNVSNLQQELINSEIEADKLRKRISEDTKMEQMFEASREQEYGDLAEIDKKIARLEKQIDAEEEKEREELEAKKRW